MKLPYVDDIREARRLSEESNRATMHIHEINAAIQAVAITQGQHALRPDLVTTLPGSELLTRLVEEWPMLKGLPDASLPTDALLEAQLQARLTQFLVAKQMLSPLMDAGQERATHLHQLQHQQRHHLEDPKYGAVVARLSQLGMERQTLAGSLAPLNQRVTMIDPVMTMLDTFSTQLASYTVRTDEPDPTGHRAWRAAGMTQRLLKSMETVLDAVKLEVALPNAPAVPAEPDPAQVERLWSEVAEAKHQLAGLHDVLKEAGERATAERDEAQARYDAVTAQIVEIMG